MASRRRYWLSAPAMVGALIRNARLCVRLLRDPRVPVLAKAVPISGLAYVLLPLDFIPDLIPILGQVDDLTLIVMAIAAFKRLSPSHAVTHHESAIAQGRRFSPVPTTAPGEVIDAEWRRES